MGKVRVIHLITRVVVYREMSCIARRRKRLARGLRTKPDRVGKVGRGEARREKCSSSYIYIGIHICIYKYTQGPASCMRSTTKQRYASTGNQTLGVP